MTTEIGFTTEALAILEAAIARGVRKVKYTDKEVTYHSLSEMMSLRNLMRRELGLSGKTTRLYAKHSKGLIDNVD